jgi:hypothetical protein
MRTTVPKVLNDDGWVDLPFSTLADNFLPADLLIFGAMVCLKIFEYFATKQTKLRHYFQ